MDGGYTVDGRRAVLLDRDGTLNEDAGYLDRPESLRLLPGTVEALSSLQAAGWVLVVVSNQSGVGRGFFSQQDLDRVDARLRTLLAEAGVRLEASYYCPHAPWDACACRKPAPGLLQQAAADLEIDLANSVMVGDMIRDVQAGQAAGCRTVLLQTAPAPTEGLAPDAIFPALAQAVPWILSLAPRHVGAGFPALLQINAR